MQTILVADDRRSHRQAICDQLSQAGFDTLQASNGLEVITLFKAHHPDLIILDVDMPEMNGFETCRVIRQTSDVPVLFLTGVMTEVADEEHGFDLLATDYLTKNIEPRKLLARVRRWVKEPTTKPTHIAEHTELSYGSLRVDRKSRRYVYSDEQRIELSTKEFGIIAKLVSDPEKAWSVSELKTKFVGEDVVRQHIKSIRDKFKKAECDDPIETVTGRGYTLHTVD